VSNNDGVTSQAQQ